ncbi:hypothetical protein TeGR_g945, partial [Tetraparma gracilis]
PPPQPSFTFQDSSLSPAAKRSKQSAEESEKLLLDSKLIFPIVPPTLTWNAPQLSFADVQRITFHPDFQPDRWNVCTDLSHVLRSIMKIALSSPPLSLDYSPAPAETLLLRLTSLARIYDAADASGDLTTFGVSTKLALVDGSGEDKE